MAASARSHQSPASSSARSMGAASASRAARPSPLARAAAAASRPAATIRGVSASRAASQSSSASAWVRIPRSVRCAAGPPLEPAVSVVGLAQAAARERQPTRAIAWRGREVGSARIGDRGASVRRAASRILGRSLPEGGVPRAPPRQGLALLVLQPRWSHPPDASTVLSPGATLPVGQQVRPAKGRRPRLACLARDRGRDLRRPTVSCLRRPTASCLRRPTVPWKNPAARSSPSPHAPAPPAPGHRPSADERPSHGDLVPAPPPRPAAVPLALLPGCDSPACVFGPGGCDGTGGGRAEALALPARRPPRRWRPGSGSMPTGRAPRP